MHAPTIARSLALAVLFATAAACRDSTGPDRQPLDPARTQADADAMVSAFDSPAINQFFAAAGYIHVGSATLNTSVAAARQLVASGGRITAATQQAIATSLRDMIVGDPAVAAVAVIPQDVRGTTFVFDPQQQGYVPSQRTGAPSNGVRYVLYALSEGWQLDPAVETGYIELTDLAPEGANAFGLRLRVVSGNTTYLDYIINGLASQNAGTLDVTGFVTNGTTRVDYVTRISVLSSQSSTSANIEFQYTIPSRNFGVVGHIIGFGSAEVGQVEIVVNSNRTQIRYFFQSGESFTGSVFVNGRLFASISETTDGVLITGAGGQQLTAAEQEVLESLLFTAVESILWSFALLAPVGWAIPF